MRPAETTGTRTKKPTKTPIRRARTHRSLDRSADHHHPSFPLLTAGSLDSKGATRKPRDGRDLEEGRLRAPQGRVGVSPGVLAGSWGRQWEGACRRRADHVVDRPRPSRAGGVRDGHRHRGAGGGGGAAQVGRARVRDVAGHSTAGTPMSTDRRTRRPEAGRLALLRGSHAHAEQEPPRCRSRRREIGLAWLCGVSVRMC